MATVAQLEGLYLAYFGRPADADGLAFYLSNPNTDIWAVARAFSESPESKALYGPTFNASVINAIYENLFNRPAEPAGVQYWSGEVAAGRLTAAGAAFAILLGAQNGDLATVQNKLAVSAAFTEAMNTPQLKAAYAGAAAAAMARSFIHSIDGSYAFKTAGLAVAEQAVAAVAGATTVNASNQVIASSFIPTDATYTLTADRPNFLAANGIVDGGYAYLKGLVSGATIEVSGAAGHLTALFAPLAIDTSSDTVNIKINPYYFDDNNFDSTPSGRHALSFQLRGTEHVNLTSTGTTGPIANKVPNWRPDYPENLIGVFSPQLQSLLITGDQPLWLSCDSPALTVVDASRLTATGSLTYWPFSGLGSVGFAYQPSDGNTPALVVIGSQACGNILFGTNWDNVLVGGPEDDLIWGSYGADTLTGGGGHDRFRFVWSVDSDYVADAAPVDTITDFDPNTQGRGNLFAPDAAGAITFREWRDGDVIDLVPYRKSTISVMVVESGPAALAALRTIHATAGVDIGAALDSTTGMLYLDTNNDGLSDTRIELVGVKTLTTAAFLLSDN